jgi:hypothetical protein
MAERWRRMSKDELGVALAGLRSEVSFPAAPEVAAAVATRLRAAPPNGVVVPFRRRSAAVLRPLVRPAWHRVAAAAAAAVLLASGVLSFSPSARRAVADFLGLGGVRIHRVPTPPSAPVRSLGAGLDLGDRMTLEQAQGRVSYRIRVPSAPQLGPPDEVYLRLSELGDQVSLVYRATTDIPRAAETGAGLLVTEFRAHLEPEFIGKLLGPGSTVEAVKVNGHPGFWIAGQPHEIIYLAPDGQRIPDTVRLAANVLVWQQGTVTVRIESRLTKDQVLRIAQSMR